MSEPIRRAVILAAGRGTRMGEMTEMLPKPMLPVAGKPMIEHIVDRLEASGIERFLVVVGFQREILEKHWRGTKRKIEFAWQEQVNGTATAALLAREFAGDEPFLLTFGDILCESAAYTSLLQVLERKPAADAVIAVKEVNDPWQGAAVYELAGRVTRIVEKPQKGASNTRWNSAGFYAFKPLVFRYLSRVQPSPRGEYELTSALEMMLSDHLELQISPVAGTWRDVGRPEDLAAAQTE